MGEEEIFSYPTTSWKVTSRRHSCPVPQRPGPFTGFSWDTDSHIWRFKDGVHSEGTKIICFTNTSEVYLKYLLLFRFRATHMLLLSCPNSSTSSFLIQSWYSSQILIFLVLRSHFNWHYETTLSHIWPYWNHTTSILILLSMLLLSLIMQWVPQESLSSSITCASYSCNSQLVYASFADGNIGVFDAEYLRLRCRIAPSAYMPQPTPNRLVNLRNLIPLEACN